MKSLGRSTRDDSFAGFNPVENPDESPAFGSVRNLSDVEVTSALALRDFVIDLATDRVAVYDIET